MCECGVCVFSPYLSFSLACLTCFSFLVGTGTLIGDLPFACENLSKHKDEEDIIKYLHVLLFASVGQKGSRKKALRQFCGFSTPAEKEALEFKLIDNKKKWTSGLMKSACDIFGLSHVGTREELGKRLADYLFSPYETNVAEKAAKAPASAAKVNDNN